MSRPQPRIPMMESAPGPWTLINGRRYYYFGGTSYLGLAGDPEVIEAACQAVRRYGVHSATSRAGFGNSPLTLEVERRAAEFFGTEDAFYFSSGYVANHILVQALAARADAIFVDEAAHYCLMEAARLPSRPITRFKHRDPGDLARQLKKKLRPGKRPLLLTDGVFSVSGRLAPLPEYLRALREHAPAVLLVDDAHGFGVLGERGRGVIEHFGLWGPPVNAGAASSRRSQASPSGTLGKLAGGTSALHTSWRAGANEGGPSEGVYLAVGGTLAKAFGGFGGIIPGTRSFLQITRQASHYFDGASAPSSADAGASAKAIEIVQRRPELRARLWDNITRLRAGLRALGLAVEDGPSANFAVEVGDAVTMRRIHEALKAADFIVPYVAAYAGLGPGGALRFAVCAQHTSEMIESLLQALRKIV